MFATIRTTKGTSRTLGYNEQKLVQGRAECLLAVNFMKDLDQLTRNDKLFHIWRRNSLNTRSQKKNLHISLNFSPKDKLSATQLVSIAKEYMQKTGLDFTPYLVYKHLDAAHPHLHVVGSAIQPNGIQKNLFIIRHHTSPLVLKQLEIEYSLVSMEEARVQQHDVTDKNAQKIIYGQTPVGPGITRVLNKVLNNYNYTSLDEFNAILSLYNVRAERGKADSLLHKTRGLLYCVINDQGQVIGSPIKASSFYNKPTLKNLEKRFALNKSHRQQHADRLRVAIDWIIVAQQPPDLLSFKASMDKQQISVIPRHDKNGAIHGIFYIDQESQTVFDGRALGERYTAAAITRRCATQPAQEDLDLRQKLIIPRQRQTPAHRQRHRL